MLIVDDPLLALILRFIVDTGGKRSTNEEFLKRQLNAIRRYLAQFPEAERGSRAMEWVVQRAANYRRDWQRNTVASRTTYLRCDDCPLANLDATEHCEIHEQWLYLLHRHLTGEVTSRDYIESALSLLREYKDQLKYRHAVLAESASKAKKLKKDKKKKKKKGKKRRKGSAKDHGAA